MTNGFSPGPLFSDDEPKVKITTPSEGGPRALFADDPASTRAVAEPVSTSVGVAPAPLDFSSLPDTPATPVAVNPGALFGDADAVWRGDIRDSLDKHPGLNPADKGVAERMAVQLLPPVEKDAAEFGEAALDASNELSKLLSELTIKGSQLGVNDFVTQVLEMLAPDQSKGLLGAFGIGRHKDFDVNAVEARLKSLLKEVEAYRIEIVTLRDQAVQTVRRLALHGAAMAAALPHMSGHPAQRIAEGRLQLLDRAATNALFSPAQQEALENEAIVWVNNLSNALYTRIPSWRALNSRQAAQKR